MSAPSVQVARPDDITPAWLTDALRASNRLAGDDCVTSVSATRIGSGQLGATYLLDVEHTGGSEVSRRIVAKVPAVDEASRAFAASLGCYSREVAFYSQIAGDLPVRTPECYHASVSADGQEFCLLLEDLTPAAEASQLTGCDVERAAAALEQAAALHAGSWRDPALSGHEWLTSGVTVWRQMCAGLPQAQQVFRERYAELVDDTTGAVAEGLAGGAASRWVEHLAEPRCLWHSDFRLDNLLFDAGGGQFPSRSSTGRA